MADNSNHDPVINAEYDSDADILTFNFTKVPQTAIAEEAGDEIWVRYDPDTKHVISVDVLNFSLRVEAAFGKNLTYVERTDPERLDALVLLPSPSIS